MRNTSAFIGLNNDSNNQRFELEAEALVNLVGKLINQIEDRLKS
jgi:hypothetical protein